MRRSVRVALALGVVAFGLAAPALPGLAATCAGATARAGAAGPTIRIGVVVDDGASTPRIDCIVVPATLRNGEMRAKGSDVLAARASQLGLPALRWDPSGLLCGIDGYPAPPRCAQPISDGYWSYWQGENGQWVYSSAGPAYRYLKDGDVDGWRFVTGQDRAPRVSAVAARCPSTTDPAPPATAPPSPTPTSPAGGGGNATSPPTTRPGTTSGSKPGTTPGSKATTTTVVPSVGGQAAAPTTTLPAAGEPTTTAPGTPTTTSTTTIEADVEAASEERAADTVAIPADESGGGGWVGTAVGVGALGAAAAGLTVLGRRRRSDS